MLGHLNTFNFHVPGQISANLDIRFTAAKDFRIVEVSAVSSNTNNGTLTVGISTDTNSILESFGLGESGVPVVKTVADFATANPQGVINAGEIVVLTVAFGGATTEADDPTITLTVLEG